MERILPWDSGEPLPLRECHAPWANNLTWHKAASYVFLMLDHSFHLCVLTHCDLCGTTQLDNRSSFLANNLQPIALKALVWQRVLLDLALGDVSLDKSQQEICSVAHPLLCNILADGSRWGRGSQK